MPIFQNLSFSALLFGALECLFGWKLRKQRRSTPTPDTESQ